ncbi:MAG: hypothetical protein R3B70_45705 [Polyangiaceae bacterium]
MAKNKQKHRQPAPQKQPAATTVPFSPQAKSEPENAEREIAAIHAEAIQDATEADLEQALSATEGQENGAVEVSELLRRAREAIALCRAREARANKAEEAAARREETLGARGVELGNREAALREANVQLQSQQEELKRERAAVESRIKRVAEREAQVLADEQRVRGRELEAEAGFSAQRRASLQSLETEAASLRAEMSQARAEVAREREEWRQQRQTRESALVAELDALRERARQEIEAQRRAAAEEGQREREALAEMRRELKRTAARQEAERQALDDDRAAFEARMEQRIAHKLEQEAALCAALEQKLAAAREDRDRLFGALSAKEEAERALGNRTLDEVHRELEELRRERGSLKAELAARPGADARSRLQELETLKEDWEGERNKLLQETQELKRIVGRSAIAVSELETIRDHKASLESSNDTLRAALAELREDVDTRIRSADGRSPFPACTQMDGDRDLQTAPALLEKISDLGELCKEVRQDRA